MRLETGYSWAPSRETDRIVLSGGLAEISRLWEWVRNLAARYGVDEELQFAIHLCLEEAVSNIIRHGYAPGATEPVSIEFTRPSDGQFVMIIEDFAPPFNPILQPEMSLLDADGEPRIGGRGIRLMRAFAHSLEYERTKSGNRLRVGFTSTCTRVPQP
jgi:serine/threonine-protein kinase RsbW